MGHFHLAMSEHLFLKTLDVMPQMLSASWQCAVWLNPGTIIKATMLCPSTSMHSTTPFSELTYQSQGAILLPMVRINAILTANLPKSRGNPAAYGTY